MLSPRSGPLEELLHPPNPPSCRSRTGVRTRVMTKGGKGQGALLERTSSRDRGVEECPHLNGVAASKSGDCGDGLAALCSRVLADQL